MSHYNLLLDYTQYCLIKEGFPCSELEVNDINPSLSLKTADISSVSPSSWSDAKNKES